MTFLSRRRPIHAVAGALCAALLASPAAADHLKELQERAMTAGVAAWGYWGPAGDKYSGWTNHSNRLIPVYTFGIDLKSVAGPRSVYRDAARLNELYGRPPTDTLNPAAQYFDQTDIARLQREALAAGKKYVVLIIFDGMDWQTTWAAAIYNSGKPGYTSGRGTGLQFLDYRGAPTDFGFCVTSPYDDGTDVDVDAQTVLATGAKTPGGYNAGHGGANPWTAGDDPSYLINKRRDCPHAVTDSAASATSLCAGIKTYNVSINVDPRGRQVKPVSHEFQARGFSIGVVTNVPISHATPACAYAHNVSRDDFQDLTRDLLALPSVAHRQEPLSGVDVLLGAGWGEEAPNDPKQGANYIPGNKYIAQRDLERVDVRRGGRYVVVERQAGTNGKQSLNKAALAAATSGRRLFGFFGARHGHLPFATADGHYDPTDGARAPAESYTPADLEENPTLADMTRAALDVLSINKTGFWLMVEPGDVDWANHDNNLDHSIGAVLSGDAAFRAVVEWIDARDCWSDAAVIVTADHGHYLHVTDPAALIPPNSATAAGSRD